MNTRRLLALLDLRREILGERFAAATEDEEAALIDELAFIVALYRDLLDVQTAEQARDTILDHYRRLTTA